MPNITDRLSDLDKAHIALLDRLTALDAEIGTVLQNWTAVSLPAIDNRQTAADNHRNVSPPLSLGSVVG